MYSLNFKTLRPLWQPHPSTPEQPLLCNVTWLPPLLPSNNWQHIPTMCCNNRLQLWQPMSVDDTSWCMIGKYRFHTFTGQHSRTRFTYTCTVLMQILDLWQIFHRFWFESKCVSLSVLGLRPSVPVAVNQVDHPLIKLLTLKSDLCTTQQSEVRQWVEGHVQICVIKLLMCSVSGQSAYDQQEPWGIS